MTLDEVNGAADLSALAGVFEHAPWVAAGAAGLRPFATVTALHQAMFDQVAGADEATRLAFLNGHPDLAGTAARQRAMEAHSTAEQSALGLDRLDEAGFARFQAMSERYRARFGFPFLICVRRHTRGSILRQFARRVEAGPADELRAALREVFLITRLRVAGLVTGPGMPAVSGGLSTHVLNTAQGRPGAGIAVEIFEIDDDDKVGAGSTLLNSAVTDKDGRVPALLDDGGPLRIGTYELRFGIGDYFAGSGLVVADPPYLDVVPVRIGIAEAEAHYHVPLLVSAYTYTTYRGS